MTLTLENTSDVANKIWIGGSYVPAAATTPIPVLNPSTGEVCGTVGDGQVEDARAAVDCAHRAMQEWKARAPRARAEVLRTCFTLMTARAEELAALVALENGKTLTDARGEIAYAAEFFRWYAEEAVRAIGQMSTTPAGTNNIIVQYEPIGVAVLVTPWNFPAAMATRKIAPALAAGCSVVLKPATETPLTAYLIAEICAEAGVPDGVLNVLTTRQSRTVVAAMLADPRVRALSFTGSTSVGKLLLKESADNVLKCSMELGGNAPFLVFEDADLEAALDGLMVAKMRNGGQACTAANRVLVHRSIIDVLGARLAERMSGLRVGPGTDERTQCGPLINDGAVANVSELVTGAIADGAVALTGGQAPAGAGSFYPPTVLVNVDRRSAIVSEEIFGPVASLIAFDSEDEAIEAANDTEYGLAAYVFTGDLGRGIKIASRLESGMVAVNRGLVSDPAAPFGGVKHSGLGREGGREGMLEFMESKYIAVDLMHR